MPVCVVEKIAANMKGEMETHDSLLSEYPNFPEESRSKLATYLKCGTIETSDVSRQDLELFRLAAKRLRISALNCVCETMENKLSKQLPTRFQRDEMPMAAYRRTNSESSGPEMNQNLHRHLRPTESVSNDEFPPKQIYFLMIGKNREGKESVLVYNILHKRLYEKEIHLKGHRGDIVGVCGVPLEDAPYLYVLVSCDDSVKMLRNDVIKDKWKTCSKYRRPINKPTVVNFGDCIYVFGANCLDIIKYSINEDHWSVCSRLDHKVTSPVVTKHGGKLYIFEERYLQVFEPFTERVTSLDCEHYTSTGYAISVFGEIFILSENTITSYDVTSKQNIREDYPSLGYRPLHAVFTGFGRVFALTTDSHGKFELKSTRDLVTWKPELTFHKSVQLELTGLVNYLQHCPIGPFETYEESLRKATFSRK